MDPTDSPGVELTHSVPMDLGELAARARGLVRPGRRVVLGIAGMPGAGKSTLAGALVDALNSQPRPRGRQETAPWVALLPMDGFHLPQARLVELGLRDRMGAPETFDATAYAQTLARITRDERPVTAPAFDRTVEEPTPAGIHVGAHQSLVVTEGNYLLLPDPPWPRARAQLAQVWYVWLDEATRLRRLVDRHVEFGKSRAAAEAWVQRSDEANARLVGHHAGRADLVVAMP
ncbi:MAG: nucleoside/nucleotide kinase family protein [Dermatophilaceae bacterium]